MRLVYDVDRSDGFGRTLAYVYRSEDGLFLNAELLRQGYAQLLTVPPNVAKVDELRALQAEARSGNRGLWNACPVPTTTTVPATATTRAAGCDSAYPDVCIPPPPPDLDCPEISYRNFRVLSPDPHRFDGDHDGVGCET